MKKFFTLATLMAFILLVANCAKDKNEEPTPTPEPKEPAFELSSDGKTLTKWVSTASTTTADLTQVPTLSQITKVGDDAFKGQEHLTSITLPNTVKSIGKRAFYGCKDLTTISFATKNAPTGRPAVASRDSIAIPASIETIGEEAFAGCSSLYAISLPNSIKTISKGLFKGCVSLTYITYNQDVLTTIEEEAFYGCANLQFPDHNLRVSSIGTRAFYGCTSLKAPPSYKLEDSQVWETPMFTIHAETVGEEAFAGCTALNVVSISNVRNLSKGIFKGCSMLSLISINNAITSIADEAFYGCTNLHNPPINENTNNIISIGNSAFENTPITYCKLPASLKTIGEKAFKNCPLNSDDIIFALPANLERIEKEAFAGANFVDLTIPKSVVFIGEGAFNNCIALTKISMESVTPPVIEARGGIINTEDTKICVPITAENTYKTNENWKQYANRINGMGCAAAIVIRNGILVSYPCDKIPADGKVIIPDGVKVIGEKAFYECNKLTSVVLPNSVNKIKEKAFFGCSLLRNINIPTGVTQIGAQAFDACESLSAINLPEGLEIIDRWAFANSGLNSIVIPNSIKYIGERAFVACQHLRSFTIEATTPPSLDPYVGIFGNLPDLIYSGDIYVPAGTLNAYKMDSMWRRYANQIKTKGGNNNNTNDDEYTGTEVPEGVIIENGVLVKWPESAIPADGHVKVPYGVTTIGRGAVPAFISAAAENYNPLQGGAPPGNGRLLKVTLPRTVTHIATFAFGHCYRLNTLIMSPITEIESNAFSVCYDLKKIVIPSYITELKALPHPDSIQNGAVVEVICKSATPITVRNIDKTRIRTQYKLIVPRGSKQRYQQANFWKEFSIIEEE